MHSTFLSLNSLLINVMGHCIYFSLNFTVYLLHIYFDNLNGIKMHGLHSIMPGPSLGPVWP